MGKTLMGCLVATISLFFVMNFKLCDDFSKVLKSPNLWCRLRPPFNISSTKRLKINLTTFNVL